MASDDGRQPPPQLGYAKFRSHPAHPNLWRVEGRGKKGDVTMMISLFRYTRTTKLRLATPSSRGMQGTLPTSLWSSRRH